MVMSTKVTHITKHKKVEGLRPYLYPADQIEPGGCHLQCGGCGFSGQPEFYVETGAPWCFDPVCNCPLKGELTA